MPFPYQAAANAKYKKRIETDLRSRSQSSRASAAQPSRDFAADRVAEFLQIGRVRVALDPVLQSDLDHALPAVISRIASSTFSRSSAVKPVSAISVED
jgi:hypothetical protein